MWATTTALKFRSTRGKMNAGLIILRVASERRDAQNERDGAGLRSSVAAATPSQQRLRRSRPAASSDSALRRSSVAAALQPSTQLVASSLEVLPAAPLGGTRRYLEEGRDELSAIIGCSAAATELRRSRCCDGAAQISSVAQNDETSIHFPPLI